MIVKNLELQIIRLDEIIKMTSKFKATLKI